MRHDVRSSLTRRPAPWLLTLAVLAACAPAAAPSPSPKPKPNPGTKPGGSPSPAASTGGLGSPGPSVPVLNPSLGPLASTAPLASPDPTATYTSQAAIPVAAQAELMARLAFLSQRSYFQGQSELISDQGGGIVSNHSSGLIANNAASILANHGGGIVSNHSSGLLSNHGAGYHLLQAPVPEVLLATTPQAGPPDGPEALVIHRRWLAGGERLIFQNEGGQRRKVDLHPQGLWPFREEANFVVDRHPNGARASVQSRVTLLAEDGSLRQRTQSRTRFGTDDLPFQAELTATGFFRFQELQDLKQEAKRYELNAQAGTGSFELWDPAHRTTTSGTLTGVKLGADRRLFLALGDPLAKYQGQLRVSGDAGALLYQKTRRDEADGIHLDFDLGQGSELRLRMLSPELGEGRVIFQGLDVGSVKLAIGEGGGLTFTLKLGPDPELVIGYGPKDTGSSPAPLKQAPAWVASTLLGGPLGDAEGGADQARFRSLRGLAKDPTAPLRWYATDFHTHRVLRIEANPWRVTHFAGTGSPGSADGLVATASFNGPLGVAVDGSGTVYVAENEGHRIRRLRPVSGTWTVDTIAGQSGPGTLLDGPGATARFSGPAYLALSGQQLFVSDQQHHCIRRIRLDQQVFPVDTVAGSGQVGGTDGPLAQAKLAFPLGLSAEGEVLHVLTAEVDNVAPPLLRRIDLATGQVTTVAGRVPSGDRLLWDGAAGQAGLYRPTALLPRPEGGFLVGGPFDLRAVLPDGGIRSVVGSDGFGDNNGPQDLASLNRVMGLAPDGEGGYLAATCPEPGATNALQTSALRRLRYRP